MLPWWAWVLIVVGAYLVVTTFLDIMQTKRSIVRNFQVVGRFRYFWEKEKKLGRLLFGWMLPATPVQATPEPPTET